MQIERRDVEHKQAAQSIQTGGEASIFGERTVREDQASNEALKGAPTEEQARRINNAPNKERPRWGLPFLIVAGLAIFLTPIAFSLLQLGTIPQVTGIMIAAAIGFFLLLAVLIYSTAKKGQRRRTFFGAVGTSFGITAGVVILATLIYAAVN